ncbi:MAG: CHAD domain-containing protein [Phycisphaerales bacterium]|nr:CHAD domain-containing protein [Phycisphaerales bacterium]
MGLVVLPGEDLDLGLLRVAGEHAAGADAQLARVAADPVGAVHEARRHIRSLRALIRILRPLWGEEESGAARGALRAAAALLSPHRDAHAQIAALDRLAEAIGVGGRSEMEWVRPVLAASLERSTMALADQAGDARALLAGCAVRLRMADGGAERPRVDIARAVAKSAGRARKSFRKAREHPRPECVHDLRKRCKDIREQVRALVPVDPKPLGRIEGGYDRVCTLLGETRDLEMLRDSLAGIGPELPEAGPLIELLRSAAAERAADCTEHALRRARKATRRGARKLGGLLGS